MERLRKLIKEVLSTPPKEKCDCGCGGCNDSSTKGVTLNESIAPKEILSENLRYHVVNKLPLTENTFRYGSEAFLNLWSEARYLYVREAIHVNELDKEILEETSLGEYGMYEGKKVPLDLPMMEEEIDEAEGKKKTPPIGKPHRGGSKKFYVYVRDKGKVKKVSFGQAGMSAKINDPKARRAFAARHDCLVS